MVLVSFLRSICFKIMVRVAVESSWEGMIEFCPPAGVYSDYYDTLILSYSKLWRKDVEMFCPSMFCPGRMAKAMLCNVIYGYVPFAILAGC